jgi:Uma2 family endonuclease
MSAVAEREKVSYAEYLALAETTDEMLEYHDGVVVGRLGLSFEHARIVSTLVHLVRSHDNLACATIPAGLKVRVEAANRTLIPDLTVVCGEGQFSPLDKDAIVNPVVIFEILPPSSEKSDQGAKFHFYRRIPSLREYVIVAQDHRFASVCRRVGDLWAFEDVEAGGVLKLEGIGVGLPLDDVYSDGLGEIVA